MGRLDARVAPTRDLVYAPYRLSTVQQPRDVLHESHLIGPRSQVGPDVNPTEN